MTKKHDVKGMMFDAAKRAAEKKKKGETLTSVEQAALDWMRSGEQGAPKAQTEPKERASYMRLALTVAVVVLAIALAMLASGMSLKLFFALF